MKKIFLMAVSFCFVLCVLFSSAYAAGENMNFDFTEGATHDFKPRSTGEGVIFEQEDSGLHFCDDSNGSKGGYAFLTRDFTSPFDGAECFAIEIKMSHKNASYNPNGQEGAGSRPRAALYFSGTSKSTGNSFGINGTNSLIFELSSKSSSNGLYTTDGEYMTYYIETTRLKDWADTDVNGIRFDPIKDGVGEGDIEYIKFHFEPSIDRIISKDEEAEQVNYNADFLEMYFSAPILESSIQTENIVIKDENENTLIIDDFSFDSANRKLTVELGEVLKAEHKYFVEILDLKVNETVAFDSVKSDFITTTRSLSVVATVSDNEVSFQAVNSGNMNKRGLIYIAVWEDFTLKDTDFRIFEISEMGEISPDSFSLDNISSGSSVEIYIYDISEGYPEFIGNEVFKYLKE